MSLVREHGHKTALFSMADPRGEPTAYDRHFIPLVDFKNAGRNPIAQTKLAAHSLYSWDSRRRLRNLIADFRPDIAHVRNIYHHLSPSILWELKARGIPVVYHLNDFKLLCPSYNMVAHGQACERCRGGRFWHVLTEGCYAGTPGSTLLLAAEAYLHKWLSTYRKCVDCFLAPSQFVRQKLIENGWPEESIEVLPHFQRLAEQQPIKADGPLLYFGRLSQEKGLADLLAAMQRLPNLRLKIAGDGPQSRELRELAIKLKLSNVEFLGHISGGDLDRTIADSRFTVLPTHAYETFGKSILESYAHGRAVIASDLGSRRELVQHGVNGLLYPIGNVERLAAEISFLAGQPAEAEKMGTAGRNLVLTKYSPSNHYVRLTELYERLIALRVASRGRRFGNEPASKTWFGLRRWVAAGRGFSSANARSPSMRPERTRPVEAPSLKIAFIGGRGVISKYSGIETWFEEAGSRLAAMGHEITVYCRSYFTPRITNYKGMRLIHLPTVRSKHFETAIHTLLSTIHALHQDCDVFHYHALGPALFSFLPRLFGKKTVVTVQGLDWRRRKWGWVASAVLRWGEFAAVRFPNATMVVSHTLHRHFQEAHAANTVYIPNGTFIRKRPKPAHIVQRGIEPGNYVLFLGRFSPEKNCHLLIEAYKRINTPVKLVLAGGSSHSDAYARELRSHASPNIQFLEWVAGEELEELITHATLFVLPSDIEGLSLALLDAMGAGVCVLASDIPENRELVDGAGFTFHAGSRNDLELMLRLLLCNPSLRQAAARRALERIRENYLWPEIARQVASVYRDLTVPKDSKKRGTRGETLPAESGRRKSAA